MSIQASNYLAPEGTCRYCGFSGKDWGFNYHSSSCTKCYNKWRKKMNAEKKRLHPNVNVNIDNNIIVTTNVKNRLYKKAFRDIPFSKLYIFSYIAWNIGFLIAFVAFLSLIFQVEMSKIILYICLISGIILFYIFTKIWDREAIKHKSTADNLLIQLAEIRKKEIEDRKIFYTSPEWKLLRKQIIKSHKNICTNCGKVIMKKDDITIDHILPRSKFPESALDFKNMQILCRSCNSAKGNKIIS